MESGLTTKCGADVSIVDPLISIIMPVRGYDGYLQTAIDSVLSQTAKQIELLLIIYPGAVTWLAEIKVDSRVRVIERSKPGIVDALNTGIANASGLFIARMDADDIAAPSRLEAQLHYLESNPDVAIAGANVRIFNDDGPVHRGNQLYQCWLNSLRSPADINLNIFVESPLPHPTWFAKTSVFKELGGYRKCTWAEDYDFLLRAREEGLRMGKPKPVLLSWREHKARLTHTDPCYTKAEFIRAKAWALANSYAKNRSVIICGTGRNARRLYDALHEFNVHTEYFVEHDNAPKRSSCRHTPVITYADLANTNRQALTISAVSAYGAREQLRGWFAQQAWVELVDYVIAG